MCSPGKSRSVLVHRLGSNPPLPRVHTLAPRVVEGGAGGLPWRYGRTAHRHPRSRHRTVGDMPSRGARLAALLTRLGPPPVHQVQFHDDAQLRTRALLGLTGSRTTFSEDRSGTSTGVAPCRRSRLAFSAGTSFPFSTWRKHASISPDLVKAYVVHSLWTTIDTTEGRT